MLMETSYKNTTKKMFLHNERFHDTAFMCVALVRFPVVRGEAGTDTSLPL